MKVKIIMIEIKVKVNKMLRVYLNKGQVAPTETDVVESETDLLCG